MRCGVKIFQHAIHRGVSAVPKQGKRHLEIFRSPEDREERLWLPSTLYYDEYTTLHISCTRQGVRVFVVMNTSFYALRRLLSVHDTSHAAIPRFVARRGLKLDRSESKVIEIHISCFPGLVGRSEIAIVHQFNSWFVSGVSQS